MIYLATFILALFLTQIARAQPQTYGDVISPDLSTPDEQYILPIPLLHASHTKIYDNKKGLLSSTDCSIIAPHYKEFHDVPSFPRIGGVYSIGPGSLSCGACWNITNKANQRHIYLTVIDGATIFGYFNISQEAFKLLNGGHLGEPLSITAETVPPSFCIF